MSPLIERNASVSMSWKDAPCTGGYSESTRDDMRAARCDTPAILATQASASVAEGMEMWGIWDRTNSGRKCCWHIARGCWKDGYLETEEMVNGWGYGAMAHLRGEWHFWRESGLCENEA
jgi:hypothetical protein